MFVTISSPSSWCYYVVIILCSIFTHNARLSHFIKESCVRFHCILLIFSVFLRKGLIITVHVQKIDGLTKGYDDLQRDIDNNNVSYRYYYYRRHFFSQNYLWLSSSFHTHLHVVILCSVCATIITQIIPIVISWKETLSDLISNSNIIKLCI